MALDPTTTAIVVVLVFVMITVTWFELRYMRRRAKSRRVDAARKPDELQDEAHNALLTTRAVVAMMAGRDGVRSEDVNATVREAQMAYDRRNYRVAIDLTKRVKDRLMALKAERGAGGELAKLENLSSDGAGEESTTKEVLQKEFPPNLVPSKFAISMAESAIEEGRGAGRDVSQAQGLLASAKARFDAKDYSGALSGARQAQKSARGEVVEVAVPASPPVPGSVPAAVAIATPKPVSASVPLGSVCPSCGALMKPDDAFCRKCGARVVLTNCPTCGTSLLADDTFCRKCGTRIQR